MTLFNINIQESHWTAGVNLSTSKLCHLQHITLQLQNCPRSLFLVAPDSSLLNLALIANSKVIIWHHIPNWHFSSNKLAGALQQSPLQNIKPITLSLQ